MSFAGKNLILSIFLLGAVSTSYGFVLPSLNGYAGLIFNATFEGINADWAPPNITQQGVNQLCLDNYNTGNTNDMQTTGINIRKCVSATNSDLQQYFNRSSIQDLRQSFFSAYTDCIASLIPSYNLECITLGLVQSFSTAGYTLNLLEQACIAADVQSSWWQERDNDSAFLNCIGRNVISSTGGILGL